MKKSISKQSAELATAVPQVIAHRLALVASSGPQSTPEDILELNRMWWEKALVACQSWNEITLETLSYQEKILAAITPYWRAPWRMPEAALREAIEQGPEASKRIVQKGLEPIHGAAVENARRIDELK